VKKRVAGSYDSNGFGHRSHRIGQSEAGSGEYGVTEKYIKFYADNVCPVEYEIVGQTSLQG